MLASGNNQRNQRIIGGMFGLANPEKVRTDAPPNMSDNNMFLVNARSGISVLLDQLSPRQIWLPSYLCYAILEAVGQVQIQFYNVDYHLNIPSLEWLHDVQAGDLVVLIDYFGFPHDRNCAIEVKKKNAWLLEDACQALLSSRPSPVADFVLFSPRKYLGVPDGGILVDRTNSICRQAKLEPPPVSWWLKALRAAMLRREFDQWGGNRLWFELFQETEATSPTGNYAMSELTKILLEYSFEYDSIALRRMENYRELAKQLGTIALFPTLPQGIVPLGFPIRVKERDTIRDMLFDHEIYPPIHWPMPDIVPVSFRGSHRLAREIMTLPCDQRYTRGDMQRMAKLIQHRLK